MIEALAVAFTLTMVRVVTFVQFAPLIGGATTPRLVKVGFSGAVALLIFSADWSTSMIDAAALSGSFAWLRFLLAVGREAILGGLLGAAFNLFLLPARIAGEFIAEESGLTFASVVTAGGDSSASPLAVLFETVASLLFFLLDLHHVFLLTLRETCMLYPIGRAFSMPNLDLVTALASAEETGMVLAAPVAVCLFVTTVVLALMTRAAPQLNLYSVGFPLRVLVSLGAMVLLLPQFIDGIVSGFSQLLEALRLRG